MSTSPKPAIEIPRTGLRSGFTPLESLDLTTDDPGYFGPSSISWRVHNDPAAVVGGVRALLLQSLHPDIMLSFEQVTDVRDDPWGRLSRTSRYVNAVTYSTRAEVDVTAARVRRIHAALGLDDPEWLLWVHCGAVNSWLDAHRRSGAPMTDAEADQYVREQVKAAELIGCTVADVPVTSAELDQYLDMMRSRLDVVPETREAARGLVWPPMEPKIEWLTPARPAWTVIALTGFGLLPRWARRMFALPGLPTTDLQANISARALRTTLLAIPESRRTNPHLAAARIRLGVANYEPPAETPAAQAS